MISEAADCPLCTPRHEVIWASPEIDVIAVEDARWPGYVRVIWRDHVAEMTDLNAAQRQRLMSVVWCVEAAQRGVLHPRKVNVAALGNQVPHLHWHVIPRWVDDANWPDAIWAPARRESPSLRVPAETLARFQAELRTGLEAIAATW